MRVKSVLISDSGMVATFDECGKQIPHLQGTVFEVMGKIGAEADENTIFEFMGSAMHVGWYFEVKRLKGEK